MRRTPSRITENDLRRTLAVAGAVFAMIGLALFLILAISS